MTKYLIVAQLPIVFLLIIVTHQVGYALGKKHFTMLAAGWWLNFLYLALSLWDYSIPGHAVPTSNPFVTPTDFASGALFWYAARRHRGHSPAADVLRGGRIPALFVIAYVWRVALLHVSAPVEGWVYIAGALPGAVFLTAAFTAVARVFELESAADEGFIVRVKLPLVGGMYVYAGIQCLTLLTGPGVNDALGHTVSGFGFSLGFVSKMLVLIGLTGLLAARRARIQQADEMRRVATEVAENASEIVHEIATATLELSHGIERLHDVPGARRLEVALSAIEGAEARIVAVVAGSRTIVEAGQLWPDVKQNPAMLSSLRDMRVKQHVNVNNLVDLAVRVMKQTRSEHVAYIRQYSRKACIECVPHEVYQVLINVLRNAHDALPTGKGRVLVKTTNLLPKDDEPGHVRKVQILIADSGEGFTIPIAEALQRGITTRGGRDRGIGMAVIVDRTESNGGTVLIHTGDEGTTPGYATEVILQFTAAECPT